MVHHLSGYQSPATAFCSPMLHGLVASPTLARRGQLPGRKNVGISMTSDGEYKGTKMSDIAKPAVALLVAVALFVSTQGQAAPDLSGTPLAKSGASITIKGIPRIVDGDTIVIDEGKGGPKERIRLLGIDAPESKQVCKDGKGADYMCGLESQQALQKLVGKDEVKCLAAKRDQYNRILGVCYDAKTGLELNKAMVDEGEAIAYTAYSKAYTADENLAKDKKAGVWKGDFQKPWDYRKMKRSASKDAKTVDTKKVKAKAAAKEAKQAPAPAEEIDDGPDEE